MRKIKESVWGKVKVYLATNYNHKCLNKPESDKVTTNREKKKINKDGKKTYYFYNIKREKYTSKGATM